MNSIILLNMTNLLDVAWIFFFAKVDTRLGLHGTAVSHLPSITNVARLLGHLRTEDWRVLCAWLCTTAGSLRVEENNTARPL